MGRCYSLSKKILNEESAEILREIKEIDDVERVQFDEEHTRIVLLTKDGEFSSVMSCAVNICSRVARETELSFIGFEDDGKIVW